MVIQDKWPSRDFREASGPNGDFIRPFALWSDLYETFYPKGPSTR